MDFNSFSVLRHTLVSVSLAIFRIMQQVYIHYTLQHIMQVQSLVSRYTASANMRLLSEL